MLQRSIHLKEVISFYVSVTKNLLDDSLFDDYWTDVDEFFTLLEPFEKPTTALEWQFGEANHRRPPHV
jgi:hypothetical protein